MKYVIMILTTLLVLVVGVFSALFGQSELSQVHDTYIRSFSNSIAILSNNEGSGGTGFIAKGKSGENYVITNGHVCGLAQNGQIYVDYADDKYLLKVVKRYQYNDLCAVEAPSHSIPLKLANDVYLGQKVHVLGHPLLEKISRTEGEISGSKQIQVIVSMNPTAKDCSGPTYGIYQAPGILSFFGISTVCVRTLEALASTTAILPGNSGSPVLNNYGNVVAVAFAANTEGVRSYFVSLDYLRDFLGGL